MVSTLELLSKLMEHPVLWSVLDEQKIGNELYQDALKVIINQNYLRDNITHGHYSIKILKNLLFLGVNVLDQFKINTEVLEIIAGYLS